MPPPLGEPVGFRLRQPHPQLDAVIEMHDVQRFDIVRKLHDAYAEAESNREILQIQRRSHHDGIGAAIVGQRDWGFFRYSARAFACAAVAPDLPVNCADRIVHGYSAACTTGAMRREWRACSS